MFAWATPLFAIFRTPHSQSAWATPLVALALQRKRSALPPRTSCAGEKRFCRGNDLCASFFFVFLSREARQPGGQQVPLLFPERPRSRDYTKQGLSEPHTQKMSSFRNAVKRKTHKERSQPESRKRFGLLEKHKDYVERARDYNRKKRRLQALKEKAAFRNPDEFYMKMQSTATKRGVHTNLGEDSIDADTLKLFKTQDLGYITLKKQSEQTKIGAFSCGSAGGRPRE